MSDLRAAHQVCGGLGFDGGKRCTHDVVEVIADVPLCLMHRSRIAKELYGRPTPMMEAHAIPRQRIRDEPTPAAIDHVVYYFGDPATQLVKIGTTTKLFGRIREVRRLRPNVLLLATEPGNYQLERRRHYQFQALHSPLPSGEREWFRKAPVLMDHIGRLRLEHGILAPGGPVYGPWVAPLAWGYDEAGTPLPASNRRKTV